ncbi:SDR family oxidoreductase [Oscillibacter sp. MSJ-2]|uniref:SDR family oxidoreductase n=1 Tax=Dysosmobacter acutus TaxID=2841504 RepID=A0ABS6FD67_9FIRM|nr:SDR family oxidoreductase [Dysosmobacter acutus]MBU5628234.1 SDR family oxidoreductase [Dysosmobacter acutus]
MVKKYEELKGKRVVVTGGASGIGKATVQRFVDEGAKVVAFDINAKALETLKTEISGLAGTATVDVSSEESVVRGFETVDALIGGIDVLVSNAGISIRKDFMETDFAQWRKVMGINLDGMFLCSMEAAKRMLPQKSGVILMTASTNGMEAHRYYADYNASKAGVILFSRTLALEFAPYIRVNSVCPGYVLTPMQRAEYTEEMMAAVNEAIPMKRHAAPEEVAALYAFLASDEAKYITGQHIPIDGGETA